MPSLDRFSQGGRDAQAEQPVAFCAGCGGEIYEHDDVYLLGTAVLHADNDCLLKYTDPIRSQAWEVAV